jgi:glycosyltransferase involved in cell wall biosynthesis
MERRADPRVVALYRASAVSGVCAAGARLARAIEGRTPWRPMIVGESVTPAQVEASPLAGAPGLIVTSWPRGTSAVGQVRMVRDALRAARADVVVPNHVPHGFIAAGLAHHEGLRCLAWMHADSHDGDELMLRCGELCDAWRAVSARARARVCRLGLDLPRASRDTMPAGVEVPDVPARWAPSEGAIRLLYAGRLEKFHKRVLDLAVLADELSHRRVRFRITIAGEGPAREELASLAAAHIAQGSINFIGAVPLSRMPELYAANDLALLVSGSEGMPTVVMEAMAHGRGAPITTRCGGAMDIVRQGVNGVIAPTGDMAGMAARLSWLSPRAIHAMGQHARADAVRLLSPESLAPRFESAVREAASSPTKEAPAEAQWNQILRALTAIGPASSGELRELADEWCRGIGQAELATSLATTLPEVDSPAERLVRRAIEQVRRDGRTRVAVYGAGRHTLKVERVLRTAPEIIAVIDDHASAGTCLDLPVVLPAVAANLGLDAIIISSDEHEREMLRRARGFATCPVLPLYHRAA